MKPSDFVVKMNWRTLMVTPRTEVGDGLKNDLLHAWHRGDPLDDLLRKLVVATNARASGLWRLNENQLILAGFGSATDMLEEVSLGFQEATRRVPLDQTGLGIVKAVVTAGPVIGYRNPQAAELSASASWIAKFEANTSLAVPIRDAGSNRLVGVIAVSSAAFIEEADSVWQSMVRLASDLGASIQRESML